MSKDSFLQNSPEDNLESLLKILDELYSFNIIQEYKLDAVEEIMLGIRGPDESEEEQLISISSLFEVSDDKNTFICDLRNTIRYVLNTSNYNLNDAVSELIGSRNN
jgi:hypothetical protein